MAPGGVSEMRADDGYQHSQKQEDDTGEDEQYDPAARSLLLIPIWGVGVIGRILFKMQGLAAVGAMGPTGLYRAAAVGADMVIAIPTVGAGAQMGGKRSPPTGKRKQYDKEGVEMKYGRIE